MKTTHFAAYGKTEQDERLCRPSLSKGPDRIKVEDGPIQYVPVQGGVEIAVTGSPDDLETYVLKEQEGWFDPEYPFVGEIIQPGMKVVDVGAGVGSYAIPLAKKLGAYGRLWAATKTAGDAQRVLYSKEHNRLNHLDVFVRDDGSVQLDAEMGRQGFFGIDFVRINTDAGDSGILSGGKRFFSENSPLVMLGVRRNNRVIDTEMAALFKTNGYDAYRLIPGLNLLVPFTSNNELDLFAVNLFCCKSDRADLLAKQGRLVRQVKPLTEFPEIDAGVWQEYLGAFSYASDLIEGWASPANKHADWEAYWVALNLFARAKDEGRSAEERYASLNTSYGVLSLLGEATPTLPRLLSLCRVMIEIGKREAAVSLLNQVFNIFEAGGEIHINEPFIAPSDEYAALDPADRLPEWLFASVLDQQEKCRAFSSYFTGKESLPVLEAIYDTGFYGPEIERRIALIKERYQDSATPSQGSVRDRS